MDDGVEQARVLTYPVDDQDVPAVDTAVVGRFLFAAEAMAWLAVGAGVVVLVVGWWLGLDTLASVIPGTVTMKPNTAVGIAGAGIAIVAERRGWRRWMVTAPALLVTVIGLVTIAEYLAGVDWSGFDELLAAEGHGATATANPGRMGFNTALDFILLGPALIMLAKGDRVRTQQSLALLVALIGFTAFFGYALGVTELSGRIADATQIAVNTSVLHVALGLGILFCTPDLGLMRPLASGLAGGKVVRVYLAWALGILTLIGLLSRYVVAPHDSHERVGLQIVVLSMIISSGAVVVAIGHTVDRVDSERYVLIKRLREEGARLEESAQQLDTRRRRFEELFDRNPNGLMVVASENGLVSSVNLAFASMFGYEPEEVVGQPVEILVPDRLGDQHSHHVSSFLASPESREMGVAEGVALWGQRKDRTEFPVEITLSVLPSLGNDEVIGGVSDLTERNQAESLRAATAAAEKANLAKSEFLSRMSHELRTPLTSVIGFAQILEIELAEHPQQESVHYIYEAGQHLLSLIDEVLNISQIEAGTLTFSLESVAVGLLIRECLDLVAPQAAERNIELISQNGHDHYVDGDRQRLKQVLLNLLSNAIKFNHDDGSITIDVTDRKGDRVRVTVTDTGPGIAPESIDKLFTPFERIDADVSQIKGTGLGLALSKGLMEAMGGAIGVDSVHGHHSAFWFELPAGTVEDNVDEHAAPPVDANPGPFTEGTLLYIEDNLNNVRLIEQLLRQRPKIKLLSAMQGSLGIELARQHKPDLILLDVHLPDISGDVVLNRLRADPRTAKIPIVVASADATARQIRRFRQLGVSDYLTKPLDLRRLLALLDEHITPDDP